MLWVWTCPGSAVPPAGTDVLTTPHHDICSASPCLPAQLQAPIPCGAKSSAVRGECTQMCFRDCGRLVRPVRKVDATPGFRGELRARLCRRGECGRRQRRRSQGSRSDQTSVRTTGEWRGFLARTSSSMRSISWFSSRNPARPCLRSNRAVTARLLARLRWRVPDFIHWTGEEIDQPPGSRGCRMPYLCPPPRRGRMVDRDLLDPISRDLEEGREKAVRSAELQRD